MKRFSQELKYISYSPTLYSDEDVKPSCSTSANTNPTATSSLPKKKSIQSSKEKRATGSSSQKAKKKAQSKGRKAGKAKGKVGRKKKKKKLVAKKKAVNKSLQENGSDKARLHNGHISKSSPTKKARRTSVCSSAKTALIVEQVRNS